MNRLNSDPAGKWKDLICQMFSVLSVALAGVIDLFHGGHIDKELPVDAVVINNMCYG